MMQTGPAFLSPCVLLADPVALRRAQKSATAGDPALEAPIQKLQQEAQAALPVGPFSVTTKTAVPPSGDKHDYLSLGTYWWPNPDTPDGLPYVRRDGQRNPEGAALDRDGLDAMGRTVQTLALAWWFAGNADYADRAALLLRTWFLDEATRMNPHLRFGQAIPGVCEGRGIGIVDTHTLPHVLDAVALLAGSAAWTESDDTSLQDWFRQYLRWLLDSDLGRQEARETNNHGSWYDLQVARFALYVGEDAIARAVLARVGDERIARQIEPDGRQPLELRRTLAFTYSTLNLKALFALAWLAEHVGIDLWNFRTDDNRELRQALDWLLPYANASKPWPYPQIKDYSGEGFAPLLRIAALKYQDSRYEDALQTLPGVALSTHRLHLLYPV